MAMGNRQKADCRKQSTFYTDGEVGALRKSIFDSLDHYERRECNLGIPIRSSRLYIDNMPRWKRAQMPPPDGQKSLAGAHMLPMPSVQAGPSRQQDEIYPPDGLAGYREKTHAVRVQQLRNVLI